MSFEIPGGFRLMTPCLVTDDERTELLHWYERIFPNLIGNCTGDVRVKLWGFLNKKNFFSKEIRKGHTKTKRANGIKAIIHALAVHYLIVHGRRHLPVLGRLRRFCIPRPGAAAGGRAMPTLDDHICKFERVVMLLHALGLPVERNKELYLQVGAMLEDSGRRYVAGGSCSTGTKRRFEMIEAISSPVASGSANSSAYSSDDSIGGDDVSLEEDRQDGFLGNAFDWLKLKVVDHVAEKDVLQNHSCCADASYLTDDRLWDDLKYFDRAI